MAALLALSLAIAVVAPAAGQTERPESSEPPVASSEAPPAAVADPQTTTPRARSPKVLSDAIELVEEQPKRLWERVRAVWSYSFTVSEDEPITIGMIVGALVLFFIGFFVARFLSSMLGRRVFPRFGLDEGASATFQTLAFYVLLAIFAIYALQWANIPLTVFTVAGGALAIGVGFGSQNVVNNFISGLILMAERPMKVGDMVEVGGTHGIVERIGARSTRIRSGDNTHVIVPNSSFLEKEVLNWTLADDLIRSYIDVGVVYGSPTDTVRELILQALSENPRVLGSPLPEVLFTEFGDSALVFRAFFWIKMKQLMDRNRVQSSIRFRIDELFREADIVIAFPQRDVHLDSTAPLEIRLLREPDDLPGA